MSIQTVPPDDRRRGNRRYAASVRTRGQDFRDRQPDEFVEFFLPNSINRKSKNQQPVLSEAEGIQNRLLLLLFFSWSGFFLWRSFLRSRRGSLAFFFLLLNHFWPSRSGFGLSDERFLFNYRSENRKCRQIG